jgi:putative ABC transport system permease protein
MQLLGASIEESVRSSIQSVLGDAPIAVSNGEVGVGEPVLERVRAVPDVTADPVLFASVSLAANPGERLQIVGLDLLNDPTVAAYGATEADLSAPNALVVVGKPDSLIVTRAFADAHGLVLDARLALLTPTGVREFTIRGLMEPRGIARALGSSLALMDVYAAQQVLGETRFDHIAVRIGHGDTTQTALERLRAAVGGEARVELAAAHGGGAAALLEGLGVGLSLIGGVAIGLGMFLIYNCASVAVVSRRRDIGILRALGLARAAVRWLFLSEAALLACTALATGGAVGVLLAWALIPLVQGAMDAYVRDVRLVLAPVSVGQLLVPVVLSCVAMTAAALLPARAAARVPIKECLERRPVGPPRPSRDGIAMMLGISVLALAATLLGIRTPLGGASPTLRGAVFPLLVLGVSQLLMGSASVLVRSAPAVGEWLWGPVGRLAGIGVSWSPRRTGIAVATFMAVVGAVLAATTFLGSFRYSVSQWISAAFPQDLTVLSGSSIKGVHANPMPLGLREELRSLSGVADVLPMRSLSIEYRGESLYLVAQDLHATVQRGALVRPDGEVGLPPRLAGAVLATPAFLEHFGHQVGDTVMLRTRRGPHPLRIVGRYLEYAGTTGALQVDLAELESLWDDAHADVFSVYLQPGADTAGVKQALERAFGQRYALHVLGRQEFLDANMEQIARSFAFTWAIDILLVLIGVTGIVVTIVTAVLERTREFGILRAIGAQRQQIARSTQLEAMTLALVGSAVGAAVGLAVGWIIVKIVVFEGLGWYVSFRPQLGETLGILLVAVSAGALAGWYPSRLASRLHGVETSWRE